MLARPIPLLALGAFAALLFAVLNSFADEQKSERPLPPITLQEIYERGVQGRLGKPLGTMVTISGLIVKNTLRNKADASEPYMLRIEKIDGRILSSPQQWTPRHFESERKFAIGDRFEFAGYETGGFHGLVAGFFRAPPASEGYGFVTEFVTRSN